MLISHRRSAYMDDDELERAAGAFEIAADGERDDLVRAQLSGAAWALRVLNAHDVGKAEDMMTLFRRFALGQASERSKR